MTQTFTVEQGSYALSFYAALRGTQPQRIQVTVQPYPINNVVKTFIWSGNNIAEERDATGATVTKRFFAEGEQRIGGSDAGLYYYTRDHFGSIREVTDVSSNLVIQLGAGTPRKQRRKSPVSGKPSCMGT